MFELSDIRKGQEILAPRILLYGRNGIGKTTFASKMPKPLFLFTDVGWRTLKLDKLKVPHWSGLIDALHKFYTWKAEGRVDYETLVIDSVTEAEAMLNAHVAATWGQTSIDAATNEFGFGRGFGYALDEAERMFEALERIQLDLGVTVLLVGHAEAVKVNDPRVGSYDRIEPAGVGRKKFVRKLCDWVDAILYADVPITVVQDGEGKAARSRAVGNDDRRVLYTATRTQWLAKPFCPMPPELEFSWDAYAHAVATHAGSVAGSDGTQPQTTENTDGNNPQPTPSEHAAS